MTDEIVNKKKKNRLTSLVRLGYADPIQLIFLYYGEHGYSLCIGYNGQPVDVVWCLDLWYKT